MSETCVDFARNINEIDWSPNLKGTFGGGFGLPWNYELAEKTSILAKKIKDGLPISPHEYDEVEPWTRLTLDIRADAEKDPVSFGWRLRCLEKILKYWNKASTIVVLGGNRCLGSNTLIYDPVAGISRRVGDIEGESWVQAVNERGEVVTARAGKPFTKGVDEIYKITLSTGETFEAAAEHLVYTALGYAPVSALQKGSSLYRPQSISGSGLSDQPSGVHHSTERAEDFQFYCPAYRGLSDEQLRGVRGICQELVPLPADVLAHSISDGHIRWMSACAVALSRRRTDARADKACDIRFDEQFSPLSSSDVLPQPSGRCADSGYRSSCKPCKSASRLHEGQGSLLDDQQPFVESSLPLSKSESARQDIQCGFRNSSLISYVTVENIDWVRTDVKWDLDVPEYHNYVAAGVVHHNSGKTFLASRLIMNLMLHVPEAEIYAFHQDDKASISIGQRAIYEVLPDEYNGIALKSATKVKGKNCAMRWDQKNGFSDSVCIIPPMSDLAIRGSQINFKTYQQYYKDAQQVEGIKGDLFWLDEEGPYQLFKTLQMRRGERPKKTLVTGTMLKGQTELVAALLDGAETIEERYSEYLGRKLPVVQKCAALANGYIFYLWTQDNPFNDWEGTKQDMSILSLEEKATRAFGVPAKGSLCKFPRFSAKAHVVKHETIPTDDCTNYLVCDPAGERNWFFLWIRVTKTGDHYVYREWPDYQDYGLWGMPSQDGAVNRYKGSRGPAQDSLGYGYKDWAALITKLEKADGKHEKIAERTMDSRFANKGVTQDEGSTTAIEKMADHGIFFLPTKGDNNIDPGIQLINDYLRYDDEKEISEENHPKLRFSERCGNTINCMQNYTKLGGNEEVYKDPIDCLRYYLLSEPCHWGQSSRGKKPIGNY